MTDYLLSELKVVYRVLHRGLASEPQLMEGQFLADLQDHLQRAAIAEGVDVSDHAAWDAWLGQPNPVACEVRLARRQVLG